MATDSKKRSLWRFVDNLEGDKVTWIIVLLLILTSIVCVFSSTPRLAASEGTSRLDIVKSQLYVAAAGLALIIICYNIKNLEFFRKVSKWGFPISFLALAFLDLRLNLGPIRTEAINGAVRTIRVFGAQFHVFEMVKVAMVMYCSWAIDAWEKDELKGPWSKKVKKIIYIYAPFLITMAMVLPGSNSSALLIGGVMFITILLGGGSLKDLSLLAALGVTILGLLVGVYALTKNTSHPMMTRIGTGISRVFHKTDWEDAYLNAESTGDRQKAMDGLRQGVSAKIAIKEGSLFGKGPGQSTQRYMSPAISEDYIFSFIIEEYGIVGGLFVMFLYVSLLARSAIIVRNCGKNKFAKLAVSGLTVLICVQAFIHIMVNADMGVMTGQTLPLISRGKSAFLFFSIAFGIILAMSRIASRSIERETKRSDSLMEYSGGVQESTETPSRDDELAELDRFDSETDEDNYGI